MKNTISRFAWLALCGIATQLVASPPILGVARSWGTFWVNGASVPGSATIFDGSSVKTSDAASQISLNGGERVMLSSNSAATVRQAGILLDRGVAEFGGSASYRVVARGLSIASRDASARIRVGIDPQNRILVASLSGPAEVRNGRGVVVARVAPGAALTLASANTDMVELVGVVEGQNGKFYLTDEVTSVKVELRANGLVQAAGKRVRVKGVLNSSDAAADDAPQVVTVDSAEPLSSPAPPSGPAAGAGATAAGVSTKAIAIMGGVAATGGTVGGLAATGVIGSSPSVSR